MNIKIYESSIKTLRPSDPNFNIVDKFIVTPRAGIEISKKCPYEFRLIITQCLNEGWLIPVANIRDRDLFWDKLEQ